MKEIMADNLVSINNVSIGYQSKGEEIVVQSGLQLEACKGELVALIGGNGAGKSTLLRTMAGFQHALNGEILLGGYPVHHYQEHELAQLMSFVSTEIIRVTNLRVFDLVSLGRFPYTNWIGRLSEADRAIVIDSIEAVGLHGFENRFINQLSDGERQKAMIARSLSQDTDLILLDEPTAYLDLSNKYEIVHILHRLAADKNKTILYSTHDLTTAIETCDRVWLMLKGKTIQGAPEDLVMNGTFSTLFPGGSLYFDKERGDFRMQKNPSQTVWLVGEGFRLNWTKKALERRDFKVVTDHLSNPDVLSVDVNDDSWIVRRGNTSVVVASILELCRVLDKI